MNPFGAEFSSKGSFLQKTQEIDFFLCLATSGRHNSAMITDRRKFITKLECRPMPNVMAALPNIGGALCSTPQSLDYAQYWNAVQ